MIVDLLIFLGKKRKKRQGRLNWPFLRMLKMTAQLQTQSVRDPQENRLVSSSDSNVV